MKKPIVHALVKAYKATFSPVFYVLGARCRHEPTCSVYTADCMSRHGVWPGLWMGVARVLRCRPGGSSGWDPAPETKPNTPFWAPWAYGDWRTHQRPFPSETVERRREADTETSHDRSDTP